MLLLLVQQSSLVHSMAHATEEGTVTVAIIVSYDVICVLLLIKNDCHPPKQ